MSQESSIASPSRPGLALETEETVTPVSPTVGLTELMASLEALNAGSDQRPSVVHSTQTSPLSGASRFPGSPDVRVRDQRKDSPTSPHRPKRYALQMWLEVEVGPESFAPPEDDSYSVDYAIEAINRAYPGCTGVYLDRAGHMLAFYGRKGSPRAGLIQEVAIEAGRAVSELPTWMGYAAKWKVRCVSLAEAKEILAGCKRLEKEHLRWERLHFQERLTSVPQLTNLSANAAPFQPQTALPTSRPVGAARGSREQEGGMVIADFSPHRGTPGFSLGGIPPASHHQYLQSSDDGDRATDCLLYTSPSPRDATLSRMPSSA